VERIEGFDPELAQAIFHIVLSHHGTLEWGSPVEPKTYEAMLLHFVDNIDAKMEMLRGARAKTAEIAPGIIGKSWPLGTEEGCQ